MEIHSLDSEGDRGSWGSPPTLAASPLHNLGWPALAPAAGYM